MNAHATEAQQDFESDIRESLQDALEASYMEGDGDLSAKHLIRELAKRGLLIVEADRHFAAILRSQLVASTAAAIKANGA